jgi:RNA polymerase sigma-70 factor (ECF subfamily)
MEPVRPGGEDLAALVACIAAGDREAFGRFYGATVGLAFGLICGILRDRAAAEEAAEEVAQEVFLQVWREAGQYDPRRGSPGPGW